MCGIAGFFLREAPGRQEGERTLKLMNDAIRRRGPDSEGFFLEGPVGLAHRRLRIIDLSPAANQPMFNEDERVGVVFNGEIYNFQELRSELEKAGHFFRSRSDTEIILHAFEQWGEAAFGRFNGIFAFAIWDGRKETPELWLVRDRFGVKPLFFSFQKAGLVFGSELKPLMAFPGFTRELDSRALFHFLKFSHVPSPFSIFRGVEQLRPGTWARFSAKGRSERGSFYDLSELSSRGASLEQENQQRQPRKSEDEWLIEVENAFVSSVRRQLVSDVPVGCFLSGGVDSSLLTWAYARAGGTGKVETFSIGYGEKEFDETGHAQIIARAFGTRHHELVTQPSDYMDLIPEVPDYFDQPFADPTLLPSLLLARFARQGVTVALSGDGGDELYFGYPHQRALLALEKLALVPKALRGPIFESLGEGIRFASRLGLGGSRLQQAGKFTEMLQFENVAELFQYFVGTIGPLRMDRLAGLFEEAPSEESTFFGPMLEELKGLPAEERVAQVFLRTFLLDTVLTKTDRATMAFGLEARVPFLDNEMAAVSARLPFRYKLHGGKSKYILRKLLENKLRDAGVSTELSHRPKQGFSVPMREWLRGDLKYLLDEYLGPERLKREGVFRPAPIRALVKDHLASHANHSHLLWSLVSFQMWKERYLG